MKTVAVVPINKLTSTKSRLAAYLSEADRGDLVFWMASRVLTALRDSGVVDRIAVVSPDSLILNWVKEQGLQPLFQAGDGLNAGLQLGRRWAADEVGAGSNCADHRGYAGYYRNRIHFEFIEFDGYLRFHGSGSFKLKDLIRPHVGSSPSLMIKRFLYLNWG